MHNISIVIPVFNEAEIIQLFYQKLTAQLTTINCFFEIIFVDDGSNDNTFTQLQKMEPVNTNQTLKLIRLSRNFGHQPAILAGLKSATGHAIITMDADFQDPPELIKTFIEKWLEGHKVVFGKRLLRNDNIFKRLTAKWYYELMYRFTDIKIKGNIGDFRLIDSEIVKLLFEASEQPEYIRGMVSWMGFSHALVPYNRPKRFKGKSKFSFYKMFRLAMKGILNFSLAPLRLGLVLGLITIPLGVFFLFYISIDTFFYHENYPLYKWISVINFIFMGFLFVLIWILAEYIGEIRRKQKNFPQFVVIQEINKTQK